MNTCRWLFGALTVVFTHLALATETLSVFENQYTAKMYGLPLEATSKLNQLPDGNYELSFSATAMLGSFFESSQLKWSPEDQTVIPLQYSYKRRGMGKNRDDSLTFDWTGKQVVNNVKNTNLPINATQKLQDSLSYQLQLRQDLLAGKSDLTYSITDGKKIKQYRFEIAGEETLKTPLGDVKTVKVKRSHKSEDRNTYAWFAKDFQYLLVRLQQEENGSAYTIYLSKASLNGKAIEHF
ncbi:MAG: DUF3108 domain-containing protein [Sphingobacteriales bacterium]|nr:MAG: DUF3108 domain-containing protein [Sphingobacteriales bacterium]